MANIYNILKAKGVSISDAAAVLHVSYSTLYCRLFDGVLTCNNMVVLNAVYGIPIEKMVRIQAENEVTRGYKRRKKK